MKFDWKKPNKKLTVKYLQAEQNHSIRSKILLRI